MVLEVANQRGLVVLLRLVVTGPSIGRPEYLAGPLMVLLAPLTHLAGRLASEAIVASGQTERQQDKEHER